MYLLLIHILEKIFQSRQNIPFYYVQVQPLVSLPLTENSIPIMHLTPLAITIFFERSKN